jgi:hypothetical protein
VSMGESTKELINVLLIVAPASYGNRAIVVKVVAVTGYGDEANIVGVGADTTDGDWAEVVGVVGWECCMVTALVGCRWWMRGRGRCGDGVHCAMGMGGVVFG